MKSRKPSTSSSFLSHCGGTSPPSCPSCLILVCGVTLYVRRALNRRLIDSDRYAMEAVQNNSRAMQSFSDKNLVSALKKKNSDLAPNQTDAAPASATKVAFAV